MSEQKTEKNILSTEEASSSGFLEGSNFFMSSRLTDITPLTDDSKGGYCRLFKAVRMGKWCVLKCLMPEYAGNPEFIALLQKEFEISYKLSHPNIVQMIGMEQIEGLGACIIMEYVDGCTLSEWMKDAKRSADEVVTVMRTIGSALDYTHQQQVVHRDIKPSNILITRNGNHVKIIDFGLADTDHYAILKQPAGTQRYIAPEHTEGKLPLDGRADIYSFGVMLAEVNRALRHPSRHLAHIARKCCEEDREKRYVTFSEIKWQSRFGNGWKVAAISLPLISLLIICILVYWIIASSTDKNSKNVAKTIPPATVHDTVYAAKPSASTTTNMAQIRPQGSSSYSASSRLNDPKAKISEIEPQIRKMTRKNWEEQLKYVASCPTDITKDMSKAWDKRLAVDAKYMEILRRKIRAYISKIVPTDDPNYIIMLGSAQAIATSEQNIINLDPQCGKERGKAYKPLDDLIFNYEHPQEKK